MSFGNRYEVMDDPACYAGTEVLKNKADLQDQTALDQFEQQMYLSRADEPLPSGSLNYLHYRKIHHHFFQDVYEWAGEQRTIRTGKGGSWFCFPENIERAMETLFAELAGEDHLQNVDDEILWVRRASYYVAEINAIHPFREGNGRCQLTFLTILMALSGFELDEDQIDPEGFMNAMIRSFYGSNSPLEVAIHAMIR